MTETVAIVDYGMGNVFSVVNALSRIGTTSKLSSDPGVVERADRIILPGVGAFSRAMDQLRLHGLDTAIMNFIQTGRPFLGICVGMQVLMESSCEHGKHTGLGQVAGTVEKIPSVTSGGSKVKVPHIGWRPVVRNSSQAGTMKDENYFYFVHSYVCKPTDHSDVIGVTDYQNIELVAAIRRDNMLGVQFHPERSGPNGLEFLADFMKL